MPGGPRQYVSEDIRLMVAKLIPQAARHQYTVALALQQERDRAARVVETMRSNYGHLVPRDEAADAIRNPPAAAEQAA